MTIHSKEVNQIDGKAKDQKETKEETKAKPKGKTPKRRKLKSAKDGRNTTVSGHQISY